MRPKMTGMLLVLCAAGLVLAAPAMGAVDKAAVNKAFGDLPNYDWGSTRAPLNVIDEAIVKSHGDDAARGDLEARLLTVLGGKATRAAKQFCCRGLAVIGSTKAVPVLEGMLADKDLSHMARYAIERIPGEAASKALRDAAAKLKGNLKIGMINSIGARHDTAGVAMLTALLTDSDVEVATAAAAALGRIGDKQATGPLLDFVAKAPESARNAAYDAALELATTLAKTDKTAAGTVFEKLYATDQPTRVRCAALKGLAAIRPTEIAPEILKVLASDSAAFRGLAISLIKKTPGADATKKFAEHLAKLPAAGQVAMLEALAAREDPAARPAVLVAASSADDNIAIAAIAALAMIGNSQDVAMLAGVAAAGGEKGTAARASLERLRDDSANAAIIAELAKAAPAGKVQLIGALASRAATEAAPVIAKLAASDNAEVSLAAIAAIGTLGDEKQVAGLVGLLKATQNAAVRTAIDKAMSTICIRVKAKATEDLVAGLSGASDQAKAIIYGSLARAGDTKAMATVVTAAKAGDDGAVRALTGWSSPKAIAPLLEIATTTTGKAHKILSLRAIIKLARLRETPRKDAIDAIAKVLPLAATAEKAQALAALGVIPTIESFKLLAPYADQKGLADAAGSAAVKIAPRVMRMDKKLVLATLEKVVANVRSERTKKTAQSILDSSK